NYPTYFNASIANASHLPEYFIGTTTHSFIGRFISDGSKSFAPAKAKAFLCSSPVSLNTISFPYSPQKAFVLIFRHGMPNIFEGSAPILVCKESAMDSYFFNAFASGLGIFMDAKIRCQNRD